MAMAVANVSMTAATLDKFDAEVNCLGPKDDGHCIHHINQVFSQWFCHYESTRNAVVSHKFIPVRGLVSNFLLN